MLQSSGLVAAQQPLHSPVLPGYAGCSSGTVLPKLGLAWRVTAPSIGSQAVTFLPALPSPQAPTLRCSSGGWATPR